MMTNAIAGRISIWLRNPIKRLFGWRKIFFISPTVIERPSPIVTMTSVIRRRTSEKRAANIAVKISAKIGKSLRTEIIPGSPVADR